MSHVTDVVLFVTHEDCDPRSSPGPDPGTDTISRINAWLASERFPPLAELSKAVKAEGGGNKVIQGEAWAGAFNYLPTRFWDLLSSLPWHDRGAVLVVVQTEHADQWSIWRLGDKAPTTDAVG